MTKRALGRGLSALIGDAVAPQPLAQAPDAIAHAAMLGDREAIMIEVERVLPNPQQPRKSFEEESLQELASSIRQNGVLQPILVRRRGGPEAGFQLIAGERRWRAAKLAGHGRIPALVCSMAEAEALRTALLENIQRQDLNAIEEAQAYRRLLEAYGATHQELADMLGKNRSTVTNVLRLLSLESSIQSFLIDGSLSMGHARSLLGLEDAAARMRLAREASKEGMSVRALEQLVQRTSATPQMRARAGKRAGSKDPDAAAIREFETRLEHHLGAPVTIHRRGQRGRIEIQFYSDSDLERVLEKVGVSPQL